MSFKLLCSNDLRGNRYNLNPVMVKRSKRTKRGDFGILNSLSPYWETTSSATHATDGTLASCLRLGTFATAVCHSCLQG